MSHLISSDSHVTIPDSAWQEYLDPEYRAEAPYIEQTDEGDFRVFEGERKPIDALANTAGRRPEDVSRTVRRLNDMRPGAWDPTERLKDQDVDGVDAEVLFFGGPLFEAKNASLRLNSYRAYNSWLSDYCSVAPNRLLGIAAVPVDSPEIAIQHIADAVKLGLRGVLIPLFPPDDDYAAPRWQPMWKAVTSHGLPVALHIGPDSLGSGVGRRRGKRLELSNRQATFLTGFVNSKFSMSEALSELIFGGVLEQNPELVIISAEAQVGWLSFFRYYIDHIWEKHRHHLGAVLAERPSFYFQRQVVATFMEDPVGLRERHDIGIDNIMWASDYPHSETTWPDSKRLTDEWFSAFGDEDQEKIAWKNVARIFNWQPDMSAQGSLS
jgi:predicted TIM-barrel fold metal-dependent hydrolase